MTPLFPQGCDHSTEAQVTPEAAGWAPERNLPPAPPPWEPPSSPRSSQPSGTVASQPTNSSGLADDVKRGWSWKKGKME